MIGKGQVERIGKRRRLTLPTVSCKRPGVNQNHDLACVPFRGIKPGSVGGDDA